MSVDGFDPRPAVPGGGEELKMAILVGAGAAILESFRPAPDRT